MTLAAAAAAATPKLPLWPPPAVPLPAAAAVRDGSRMLHNLSFLRLRAAVACVAAAAVVVVQLLLLLLPWKSPS